AVERVDFFADRLKVHDQADAGLSESSTESDAGSMGSTGADSSAGAADSSDDSLLPSSSGSCSSAKPMSVSEILLPSVALFSHSSIWRDASTSVAGNSSSDFTPTNSRNASVVPY